MYCPPSDVPTDAGALGPAGSGATRPGVSARALTVSGVSDLPDPQPTVDDLSKLIPEVVPDGEADPELVSIGERYWALAGCAPELDTPVWCEKVKGIDSAGPGHQIYAVAASGVWAVVSRTLVLPVRGAARSHVPEGVPAALRRPGPGLCGVHRVTDVRSAHRR